VNGQLRGIRQKRKRVQSFRLQAAGRVAGRQAQAAAAGSRQAAAGRQAGGRQATNK
jgi:hypothetical protein